MWRVGTVTEWLVVVWNERCEWVDPMRWLHHRNLTGQCRHRSIRQIRIGQHKEWITGISRTFIHVLLLMFNTIFHVICQLLLINSLRILCPPDRLRVIAGDRGRLRLIDQRGLEICQIPLGEGILPDLLLLIALVFEGDHLIAGAQVLLSAAAQLGHGSRWSPLLGHSGRHRVGGQSNYTVRGRRSVLCMRGEGVRGKVWRELIAAAGTGQERCSL